MSNLVKSGNTLTQQNASLISRQQLAARRPRVLPKVPMQEKGAPRMSTGGTAADKDNIERTGPLRQIGTKTPFFHKIPAPQSNGAGKVKYDKQLYQQSLALRLCNLSSDNPNEPRTLKNRDGATLVHLSARLSVDATGAVYEGHNAAGQQRTFKELSLGRDETLPQRSIMSIKQEIVSLAAQGVVVDKTYLAGAKVFFEIGPRQDKPTD